MTGLFILFVAFLLSCSSSRRRHNAQHKLYCIHSDSPHGLLTNIMLSSHHVHHTLALLNFSVFGRLYFLFLYTPVPTPPPPLCHTTHTVSKSVRIPTLSR